MDMNEVYAWSTRRVSEHRLSEQCVLAARLNIKGVGEQKRNMGYTCGFACSKCGRYLLDFHLFLSCRGLYICFEDLNIRGARAMLVSRLVCSRSTAYYFRGW